MQPSASAAYGFDSHPLGRLPCPPGKSPFRIKGTAYIGHLKWVEIELPGGIPAFHAAYESEPELLAFHKQKFLSSGWYDHFVLAQSGVVCARMMKMTFEEFIAHRARFQADVDINGVYKLLFKITSAKMIASRLPLAMAQYFDYGKVSVASEGATSISFSVEGIPEALVPWMRASWKGFLERAVVIAGASDPKLRQTGMTSTGSREGIPVVKVDCTLDWK